MSSFNASSSLPDYSMLNFGPVAREAAQTAHMPYWLELLNEVLLHWYKLAYLYVHLVLD